MPTNSNFSFQMQISRRLHSLRSIHFIPFSLALHSFSHSLFFLSVHIFRSLAHVHIYTAPRWREISSCPINRCRRTKIEHVSSGAVQRWQGIYHDGPSPFPHPVFPGLQPSQVLWLITPAIKQQENSAEASFWQEKTLNKRILSQRKDESFVSALHSTPTSRNESTFWISHVRSDSGKTSEEASRQKASHFSCELRVKILLWVLVFSVAGWILSDVVFITSMHNFSGIYQSQCHLGVSVISRFAVMDLCSFMLLVSSLPQYLKIALFALSY